MSVSTVSKALNDNGRMAEATRERIKKIAREIGFRPNALARGLLSNRSFTVGLLTNDTYGRFTLPVMAGISEALVDHGVSVFHDTEMDSILRSLGVRTVILLGVSLNIALMGSTIEAVNRGYQVVLPRDGVVGTPPEYAEAVLENSMKLLATITTCGAIIERLREGAGA